MAIDPLKITHNIRESYIRYLTSTFRLRDVNLRRLFLQEAEKFWFTNGPFLEATPPFQKGCYIKDLIEERLLIKTLENFIYDALPYLRDYPLYLHQEKALRKILNDKNVVVASGTSSGKTECFLIPIYNHLLKEFEDGKLTPGVRALLLYPMNALVNDQLRRLREIARVMEGKIPNIPITFGRYVGDTEEKKEKGKDRFIRENPGAELAKSELLSREEMRENPPNILITNYAMLEYLLLRPKDSPFFDGEYSGHWKFLVLDEAHIYNGATGIEMAMLIRRLKDRVCERMEGDLQCIATSATLVKEEEDFGKVAQFATNLFGEKFEWDFEDNKRQDIIKGEKIEFQIPERTFNCPIKLYSELDGIIKDNTKNSMIEQYYKICKENGVTENILYEAKRQSNDNCKKFLYEIFSRDLMILKLKNQLKDGSKSFEDCFKKLIKEMGGNTSEENRQHIISMVNIAVWARSDKELLPLLPARYHLFVRAPEGIFISFYPEPKIFLDRREQTEQGYPVFELASCRRCGQEYLVGDLDAKDGKLKHTFTETDTPKKNRYFALKEEKVIYQEDEDQEVAVPENEAKEKNEWNLCVKCGVIWETNQLFLDKCISGEHVIRTLKEVIPKKETVNKCHLCGLRSINIVREFIFQQDAPAAVLVTALYQNLEKKSTKDKKILTFSDSRQDAAFFAPYLEFTYTRILFRRLIVEALHRNNSVQDYRLKSLCEDVLQIAEEKEIFEFDMDAKEKRKEIWKWILQDFCGVWDRRNSLEGVGLISFIPIAPENWKPIKELRKIPWNLSDEESVAVYQQLLNTLRFNMAINFPEDLNPQDDFFAPRNREYKFRSQGSDIKKGIYSFIPAQGRLNARLEYLKKLYKQITHEDDADNECGSLLEKMWDDLKDHWVDKGIHQFSNPSDGVLFQLNYRYWQITQENDNNPWHICDRCGLIAPNNVRCVCPTFNCNGKLEPIDSTKREHIIKNHYRHLYSNLSPTKMTSQEHTAQLTTDYASNIQQKFIKGDINILSCSTTFELGVDLGELETIFLRNVPPEPSNYIQRAGRAGRRLDTVGFTLTFAQLRSHDLTYFKEPEKMVEGRIKPPVVEIQNEKIVRRHLHSVVMSNFFRKLPDFFGTAESFFKFENNQTSGTEKLKKYLETRPEFILKSLQRVLPQRMYSIFNIENWGWVDDLIGDSGILTIAHEKIQDEYTQMKEFYKTKGEELKQVIDSGGNKLKESRLTKDRNWADDRMKTIQKKQLIDYLATHSVIPKYGFPVDVVELATLSYIPEAKNIQLERDLRIAISEYAPGSQIVANGYIWESSGLRKVRNRAWPIYWYSICPECKQFIIQKGTIEDTPSSISCKTHGNIRRSTVCRFITPIFGFVTDKEYKPKKPGESRPKREFTTRPYFFDYKEPEAKKFPIGKFRIKCSYSSDGELAVICKGKRGIGFWVCFTCGASFSEIPKEKHKTPYGIECSSPLRSRLHLGHTFQTDVLSISIEEPRIEAKEDSFWFSLLYAILEGASHALGIKRQDLDGCLYPSEDGIMLILFDNVPGGAGHVKRIMDRQNLHDVLVSTLARVNKCTCGPETSCYGCLRNYQNQFCHNKLKREFVMDFLESNLEGFVRI